MNIVIRTLLQDSRATAKIHASYNLWNPLQNCNKNRRGMFPFYPARGVSVLTTSTFPSCLDFKKIF